MVRGIKQNHLVFRDAVPICKLDGFIRKLALIVMLRQCAGQMDKKASVQRDTEPIFRLDGAMGSGF